jgi:uncharacterized membrane protein
MTGQTRALLIVTASALGAPAAMADTVEFELIPGAYAANDLSANGRFVVGDSNDGPYLYDVWLHDMTILPPPGGTASAVSDDGTVVLGSMPDPDTGMQVAAIWTSQSGWQGLGGLEGSDGCDSGLSTGYELSADGSVAVGLAWDGCSSHGFVWSAETGMIALELLANGTNRASTVSADGTVIAGFAQGSFSRTPAMWSNEGDGELLDPPNGDVLGEINGISDDGSILLGTWDGDAALWTAENGVEPLDPFYVGWEGNAMDIADDGTLVGFDTLLTNRRAWIKRPGQDLMDFREYVVANGGEVPAGAILEVCQAVSADGLTVIGHSFGVGAWMVTIEPDCDADVDGSGVVDVDDLVTVILAWGTDDPAADVDGSGVVDVDDMVAVILAWGAC